MTAANERTNNMVDTHAHGIHAEFEHRIFLFESIFGAVEMIATSIDRKSNCLATDFVNFYFDLKFEQIVRLILG